MPSLKVYSGNEVTFNFAGIPIESGRGDDEFITISKAEDTYKYKAGNDGEGTRSENKNTLHTVTLTLMRTSSGNAMLSAIHNGDIKIPGGSGVAPMMIRDRQGLSVFVSAEAWIKKMPDDAYATEAGTIKWEFDVHDPVHVIGGN
jgi:hypothetical protein